MRWWLLLPLRLVAGMTGRLLRYVVMMLVVAAVSLSFSIASFIIPGLASVMFRAASAIANTAVVSVQQAHQLRQRNAEIRRVNDRHRVINRSLSESNVERNREKRQLAGRNARLATANADLRGQNARLATVNADLEGRNARLATAKVDLEGLHTRLATANADLEGRNAGLVSRHDRYREATRSSAQRISSRSARATSRSVAAIPLESVPFLGVATIIATTSWDIHDTCATLEDMADLQRKLKVEEPDEGIFERICGAVPLAGQRADQYGDMSVSECRSAARNARAQILKLAEQDTEIDLLADEEDVFEKEILNFADAEHDAINHICDCIFDVACDPAEMTRGVASNAGG